MTINFSSLKHFTQRPHTKLESPMTIEGDAPTPIKMALFFWYLKHLYNNHFEQVETQLAREPLPLPKLVIKRKPDSIFDYQYEDFEIVGYQSHPAIKAPVAV